MGMSVLSASTDGETYQRFYLDKPAVLRKGVYFPSWSRFRVTPR